MALLIVVVLLAFAEAKPQVLDTFQNPSNQPVLLTSHQPDVGTKWVTYTAPDSGGLADPVPQVGANNGGFVRGDPARYRSSSTMTLAGPFKDQIVGESVMVLSSPLYQSMILTHNLMFTHSNSSANALMFQWIVRPTGAPIYGLTIYEIVQGSNPKYIAYTNITTWFPPDTKMSLRWEWYANKTCAASITIGNVFAGCRATSRLSPTDLGVDTILIQFESENSLLSLDVSSFQIN